MGVVTAAVIGASVAVAGSAVGAISAHQSKQRAKGQMMTAQRELEELESNRQDVINPYEGVTDLSSMVSDVSNMASNPFANLSVSTAAAEMQIEEADIALANTLDTLRATGASAGGATALAQAALQSKKDVAADIERQEVQNDKARIQGEANLQKDLIAEAQRMQSVDVQGKQFVYSETEQREQQQLDRVSNQIAAQQQNLATSQANQSAATSGMFSALGGIATSAFGS